MGSPLLTPRQTRKATKRAAQRKAKADARIDAAVERELALMGVEGRAVACAVVLNTAEMQAHLNAARLAGGPYEGAEGYHKLRKVFTDTLVSHGVDMAGLMLKFAWDPKAKELGVSVSASPEIAEVARAAVEARLPKLALVE